MCLLYIYIIHTIYILYILYIYYIIYYTYYIYMIIYVYVVCVCASVCSCRCRMSSSQTQQFQGMTRHDWDLLGISWAVNSEARDGSPLSSSLPKQGRHFQPGACVRKRSHGAKACRSFHHTELRALSAPKSDVPMSTSPAEPSPDSTRKLKTMATQNQRK